VASSGLRSFIDPPTYPPPRRGEGLLWARSSSFPREENDKDRAATALWYRVHASRPRAIAGIGDTTRSAKRHAPFPRAEAPDNRCRGPGR
jgi:hypothetical protein